MTSWKTGSTSSGPPTRRWSNTTDVKTLPSSPMSVIHARRASSQLGIDRRSTGVTAHRVARAAGDAGRLQPRRHALGERSEVRVDLLGGQRARVVGDRVILVGVQCLLEPGLAAERDPRPRDRRLAHLGDRVCEQPPGQRVDRGPDHRTHLRRVRAVVRQGDGELGQPPRCLDRLGVAGGGGDGVGQRRRLVLEGMQHAAPQTRLHERDTAAEPSTRRATSPSTTRQTRSRPATTVAVGSAPDSGRARRRPRPGPARR